MLLRPLCNWINKVSTPWPRGRDRSTFPRLKNSQTLLCAHPYIYKRVAWKLQIEKDNETRPAKQKLDVIVFFCLALFSKSDVTLHQEREWRKRNCTQHPSCLGQLQGFVSQSSEDIDNDSDDEDNDDEDDGGDESDVKANWSLRLQGFCKKPTTWRRTDRRSTPEILFQFHWHLQTLTFFHPSFFSFQSQKHGQYNWISLV